VFDCSLPLAAMFAGLPPSSSEMTERKTLFRHLLLQIGGTNIGIRLLRRRSQRKERLRSLLLSTAARDSRRSQAVDYSAV
jgi:hypothetical protein